VDLPWILVPLFFVTAALYTSGGFGGGSTYTALLSLGEVATPLIPIISLSCNLTAVASGQGRTLDFRQVPGKDLLLLLLVSTPGNLLGSWIALPADVFRLFSGLMLVYAGISLGFRSFRVSQSRETPSGKKRSKQSLFLAGTFSGLLAGLTGIGGGIYLAPWLYATKRYTPKQVAAITALFIGFNSLVGLGVRLVRGIPISGSGFFPLVSVLGLAVFFGGQVGSRWRAGDTQGNIIRYSVSFLIVFAGFATLCRILLFTIFK